MIKSVCIVPDCAKKELALGLCWKDYEAWKSGDVTIQPAEKLCRQCGDPVPIRRGPRDYCDAACKQAARGSCTFEGCDKPMDHLSLCIGHVAQKRSGRELTALQQHRSPGSAQQRDELGRKYCPGCSCWVEAARFHVDRQTSDGAATVCADCARSRALTNRYGITSADYGLLLEQQGGQCRICLEPPGWKALAVDHDHGCCPDGKTCGRCIRGLLCEYCNPGLGMLYDNPDLLARAAEYLRRPFLILPPPLVPARKVPATPGSAPGMTGRLGADTAERSCSVRDCKRRHGQMGFCRRHYEQWRNGIGDLTPEPRYCGGCGAEVPVRKSRRDFCDTACRKASEVQCRYGGCGNVVRQRQLCAGHLDQQARGEQLAPLVYESRRQRGAPLLRDEGGRKFCPGCQDWRHPESFGSATCTPDLLANTCLDCCRSATLKAKYGITLTQYEWILAEQGGGCAICSTTDGRKRHAVDHDHGCCPGERTCGRCLRGLLCIPCNMGIGFFREREKSLRRAAEYVRGQL